MFLLKVEKIQEWFLGRSVCDLNRVTLGLEQRLRQAPNCLQSKEFSLLPTHVELNYLWEYKRIHFPNLIMKRISETKSVFT
jgi:hypothetical protein